MWGSLPRSGSTGTPRPAYSSAAARSSAGDGRLVACWAVIVPPAPVVVAVGGDQRQVPLLVAGGRATIAGPGRLVAALLVGVGELVVRPCGDLLLVALWVAGRLVGPLGGHGPTRRGRRGVVLAVQVDPDPPQGALRVAGGDA